MPRGVTFEDALSMALMHVWLVRLWDIQKTALAFLYDQENIERKMILVTKNMLGSIIGSVPKSVPGSEPERG